MKNFPGPATTFWSSSPPGSGKTVEIVTLVAMHLGRRFSHVVIAAPQTQIEEGFTKRDYDTVVLANVPGVAVPSIQVPNKPPNALIKGRAIAASAR